VPHQLSSLPTWHLVHAHHFGEGFLQWAWWCRTDCGLYQEVWSLATIWSWVGAFCIVYFIVFFFLHK
jgi:hypothetical protein